jgi:glycosyltransferase involved in cell wall biosynthesis
MTNYNPLISVVIPTYNRERFIVEAVQSVFDQTYTNWEAIIVDDGSKDATREVLSEFMSDPRVHYYYQENQGQSVARNHAIKKAKGDFICFLDSDNKWLPEKLSVSVRAALSNPDADIIYGDNITIDIDGKEISRESMKKFSGHITDLLLRDNFISMNSTMTKRECFETLGAFNEKDRLAEDYELWLRMSTKYKFLYVPEFMGYYRVMEDQLSTDKDKRFWANYAIISKFVADYPHAVSFLEKHRSFSSFFCRKARYESSVGRSKTAWNDALKAMIQYPFWFGPWRVMIRLLADSLKR